MTKKSGGAAGAAFIDAERFHAIDAERAILGAAATNSKEVFLFLNKEDVELKPIHFVLPLHGQMWKVITNMADSGKYSEAFEATQVAAELRKRGILYTEKEEAARAESLRPGRPADAPSFDKQDKKLTLKYVAEIFDSAGAPVNAPAYGRLIIDTSLCRALIDKKGDMEASFYKKMGEEQSTPQDIADSCVSHAFEMLDMVQRENPNAHVSRLGDKATEIFKKIAEISDGRRKKYDPVKTGFPPLDKYMGGIHPGEVVVIGARPGFGKTSLALHIASAMSENFTDRDGVERKPTIHFASLEMSAEQVVTKMISMATAIDQMRLLNGDLSGDEMRRVAKAMSSLEADNFYIDENVSMNIDQLRAGAMASWRRGRDENSPLRLVVVDYLQLLEDPAAKGYGASANRAVEVAAISRKIKKMAMDLQVVVLALAQVNRANEGRLNTQHMLSDLRESGAIEQDADRVLFMEPPGGTGKKNDDGMGGAYGGIRNIVFSIAKNRHGPSGRRFGVNYAPSVNQFQMAQQEYNNSPAKPPQGGGAPPPPSPPPDGEATPPAAEASAPPAATPEDESQPF